MKKFVAILLTLMLVLGIGAAVADTPPTDIDTVTIYKSYKNVNDNGISPEETFTLVQVEDGKVVDGEDKGKVAPHLGTITGATYADYGATTDGAKLGITVELPSYDKVGVYEYTLKEVAGTTAGVTYYGQNIKLVVTVVNGENNDLLPIAGVHTESSGDKKSDTFENTYSAGILTVDKQVKGNLGDKNKEFSFTVTFEAPKGKNWIRTRNGGEYSNLNFATNEYGDVDAQNPTIADGKISYTLTLKNGGRVSFGNLPYGVSYTVTETGAEEKDGVLMNGDYKVTMTGNVGVIDSAATEAKFVNTKEGSIDTGVTTENLPYVLLLGFVVLAGAALLIKRKAHNN